MDDMDMLMLILMGMLVFLIFIGALIITVLSVVGIKEIIKSSMRK